jgi:hypothetical protein
LFPVFDEAGTRFFMNAKAPSFQMGLCFADVWEAVGRAAGAQS